MARTRFERSLYCLRLAFAGARLTACMTIATVAWSASRTWPAWNTQNPIASHSSKIDRRFDAAPGADLQLACVDRMEGHASPKRRRLSDAARRLKILLFRPYMWRAAISKP